MWKARPEVLLPLVVMGTAFTAGWWRLSRRSPQARRPAQLALAAGGATTIAVALLSPLDPLAHASFSAHMVQHMLLMMAAPPLLLLSDPLPTVLWALPKKARLPVGRLLVPGAPVRGAWRAVTWMPVAWLISTLALWLWHLPAAYDAALSDDFLHDLEHLMFFWAGVLFWWPIINPPPRIHGHVPYSYRIIYMVLAGGQQALLGLLLMMSPVALYPSYEAARRLTGLDPLDDQARGGVIMWATSGLIGLATLMSLMYCLLEQEERVSLAQRPPTGPSGSHPREDDRLSSVRS